MSHYGLTPRMLRNNWLRVAAAALALLPLGTQADTIASLLGNFTTNQYCGLRLGDADLSLHYVAVFGQLPALKELHAADANGDGVTTQQERDDYVRTLAPGLAQQLLVTVDGVAVPLTATHWTTSLPSEQAGFSMRVDIDFTGPLPAARGAGASHTLVFKNDAYPGSFGWHEIATTSVAGIGVYDSNGYGNSMTAGLSNAVLALPADGPLDERDVHMRFVQGEPPAGAQSMRMRDGAATLASGSGSGSVSAPTSVSASSPSESPSFGSTAWLELQTRRLIALISGPDVPLRVTLMALVAALVLGAFHALSPGHGKTIVGAYLVGSRGTARHAVFLGLTVTVTHTLVVFLLGGLALVASRYILPERLIPILSLVSGLLVLGMGLALLRQRWRAALEAMLGPRGNALSYGPALATPHGHVHSSDHFHADGHAHEHAHSPVHAHSPGHEHVHGQVQAHRHDPSDGPVHDHPDGHAHGNEHGHDHSPSPAHSPLPAHSHSPAQSPAHSPAQAHSHDPGDDASPMHPHPHPHSHSHAAAPGAALMHSHGGGTAHSHLPPGADGRSVSWRSLLALGVSGGLVPCPSALVLLLAAVALNKTLYGLLLVTAFSVGLALTLTAVGLVFLHARRRFVDAHVSRWPQVLPVASAVVITLVGVVLTYGALASTPGWVA
ncbi:MAG TPA: sulfite exporter TauE/SafE family protein [Burkholderiaceae bacterium]|nr:sulfite exporter TauE/SafE family protein [Burkholderiaceae bacterium]